jgi:glycosyltransferase involved in cell wall biosynthesis
MAALDHVAEDHVAKTNPDTAKNLALRVLFVSHTYVVGVNQGKLRTIAAQGLTVGLLAPSNWKSLEWDRVLPLEQSGSGFKIYPGAVAGSGRGGAHGYAPWRIWQVLQDFQPDVIQVEEEVFSVCALELALWARLRRTALVVFGWENQRRSLSWIRRWMRQYVLETAVLVIAGNQDGARLLHEWGYRGLVEVMPQMGIDPAVFRAVAPADRGEFWIGYLGRLVPEKGIDTLLAAVGELRSAGVQVRLIICGSGSGEADLRRQAEGLGDWVTWQGGIPHDQAPAALAQFDGLVLPSRSTPRWKEQFGHVLIEAMAIGVPVVGSDSGEIPHVIGRRDLVFAEGDAIGLARILRRLVEDREWRTEVRRYGLERVERLYTHDRIAERLVVLWQKILGWGEGQ